MNDEHITFTFTHIAYHTHTIHTSVRRQFIRMCVVAQKSLHSYVVLTLPVNRSILLNLMTILRIEFR